jgi:hypothetical protein
VGNSDSEDKIFIDSRGHGRYKAIPYVEKQNGYVGKCRICKETTEVWKMYSYMDRQFLELCTLDIYHYIVNLPSLVLKSGKIPTKNPHDEKRPISKTRFWTGKYFCEKCGLGVWHTGKSEYIGNKNGIFSGNCNECGSPKSGKTLELQAELHNAAEKIKEQKLKANRSINTKVTQEYFDSMMEQIKQKRKNRNKSTKKIDKDLEN